MSQFAVLPAAKPEARKGIFVVATGGPGSSGILSGDYYITGYDQEILDRFDIVFFDQRGMGLSGGLTCPEAARAYYQPENLTNVDPAENHKQIARAFSENCVREMENKDLLPYIGTAQAIDDLEFFRRLIGEDKIWLYGESYGTQFAQQYAEKYPTHLAGMILDGTVDLTLSGLEFYRQQAQGLSTPADAEACLRPVPLGEKGRRRSRGLAPDQQPRRPTSAGGKRLPVFLVRAPGFRPPAPC